MRRNNHHPDKIDLDIVRAINEIGVPQLTEIAKRVGLSHEGVRYRLNKLIKDRQIAFYPIIEHLMIGLTRVNVFVDVVPKCIPVFPSVIKAIPYWTYYAKSLGNANGYQVMYLVPNEPSVLEDLDSFFDRLVEMGIVNHYTKVRTLEPFRYGHMFNDLSEEHYTDILEQDPISDELEPYLKYASQAMSLKKVRIDDTDIAFIEELIKSDEPVRKYTEIAEKLGMKAATLRYHVREHLVKKRVFRGVYAFLLPPYRKWGDLTLIIEDDGKFVLKFVSFLVKRKHQLLLYATPSKSMHVIVLGFIYFPFVAEVLRIVEKAAYDGFVKSYKYFLIDTTKTGTNVVYQQNFKNGEWVWDFEKYVTKMEECARRICLYV